MNAVSASYGQGGRSVPVDPAALIILVVGTDHHPFDRAVRWMDTWAARHPQVRVVIQYGTSAPPVHAAGHSLLPFAQLQELTAQATAVVTHGGPATIMEISRRGRLPLVIPRDPALGEHVDHHQQRFVRAMSGSGLFELCEDQTTLAARLDAVLADPDVLDRSTGPDLDVTDTVEKVRGVLDTYLAGPARPGRGTDLTGTFPRRAPMDLRAVKDRSPRWAKDVARASSHTFARATVRGRSTPDFLVIGTKRGGTTSMFNYLLMHPGVRGIFPASRGKKSTDYFFREYHRGDTWYRAHFDSDRHKDRVAAALGYRPVSGEASPYYLWDPRVARRVHDTCPRVKAIALLRDPVKRAWSHYLERRQNHVEPLTFEQALAAETTRTDGELARMLVDPRYYSEAFDWYPYRARGIYQPQLENWTSVFDPAQLLVLRAEDLYRDVQGTFNTVCDFLEIGRFELPDRTAFNAATGSTDPMPEAARAELTEFFAPHNERLAVYLRRDLGWSVPS